MISTVIYKFVILFIPALGKCRFLKNVLVCDILACFSLRPKVETISICIFVHTECGMITITEGIQLSLVNWTSTGKDKNKQLMTITVITLSGLHCHFCKMCIFLLYDLTYKWLTYVWPWPKNGREIPMRMGIVDLTLKKIEENRTKTWYKFQ